MKLPHLATTAGAGRMGTLIGALVLVALVPTVGVLWFMAAAMSNERLAVRERFAEVHRNHLVSLQRQLSTFWQERQAALQPAGSLSSAEAFAAIVRAKTADSVIVFTGSDKPTYPITAGPAMAVEEPGEWAEARELEFQKQDYAAAAFGRIADATTNVHGRARARQAQAGCLLKAGKTEEALRRLAELGHDALLRHGSARRAR